MKKFALALSASLLLSACAHEYSIQPIARADQQVKYAQGSATIFSDGPHSSIQVTPFGRTDDGNLTFGVAAFNKGPVPANFDSTNVVLVTGQGKPVQVFTAQELVHQAKVKAAWQAAAIILAGAGAAVAANSNAYSTTNGSIYTPRGGVYTYTSTTYDPGVAAAGTAAAGVATGVGLVSVRNSLDQTIASVRGNVLQMTTVETGASVGGEIVSDVDRDKYPQTITLSVNWQGDTHIFVFSVVELK
jgi:hypothetical protein